MIGLLNFGVMSLGDEGTRFLALNKNKLVAWHKLTNEEPLFSYNLISSFSPNYDVHYRWKKTSDVYHLNIDTNRVLNLTEVDSFLTKHVI